MDYDTAIFITFIPDKESLMNARSYRVTLNLTPVDFPPMMGLGQSSVFYRSEPPYIVENKVVLSITNGYFLHDINNNRDHEIFRAQSVYEIPCNEIKSREDVYELYNDSIRGMNEAYQFARKQLPDLLNISFPTQPIESYKKEIDRVFDLLNSRN